MAAVRGSDTRPEMLLRRGLHARGFRFRLHDKRLPGRPDLVLPKYRAAVFANGCFWHGHGCDLFRWPATRAEFWQAKIGGNRARDAANLAALGAAGWRVAVVWECAIKGRHRRPVEEVIDSLDRWLHSDALFLDLAGRQAGEPA